MPNPAGTNSPVAWDRFTRQIPYGEKKVQGDLQRSVPVAGASAAATPLNAAVTAGDRAKRPPRPQTGPAEQPAQSGTMTGQLPEPPAPPTLAETWAAIASTPGASPLLADYAERAAA